MPQMSSYLKKDLQAHALNRRGLYHLELKTLYLVEVRNKAPKGMKKIDPKHMNLNAKQYLLYKDQEDIWPRWTLT